MKNRIYKYFFHEFLSYFTVVLFALTAIIWTIQAVNYLDLVTDDGHAFSIYLYYSILTVPKILTKLIPFSFLISLILTILKLDKDNELLVLWTSGLNKIHVVNFFFRVSLLVMISQLIMTTFITPKTLNFSRSVLKNSQLQFVPSLLKEKTFNDTVKHLTVFVDEKKENGEYRNILIRDDSNILTQVSDGSSTIVAKSAYMSNDEKSLILYNGFIQKIDSKEDVNSEATISVISFDQTTLNLDGLTTKTISDPKIQETSTIKLIECINFKSTKYHNCTKNSPAFINSKIEINKRLGIPMFLPLVALLICFLLSNIKKNSFLNKYILFFIALSFLIGSEITVRYSGLSSLHMLAYYLIPIGALPLIYLLLIKKFKYENL